MIMNSLKQRILTFPLIFVFFGFRSFSTVIAKVLAKFANILGTWLMYFHIQTYARTYTYVVRVKKNIVFSVSCNGEIDT